MLDGFYVCNVLYSNSATPFFIYVVPLPFSVLSPTQAFQYGYDFNPRRRFFPRVSFVGLLMMQTSMSGDHESPLPFYRGRVISELLDVIEFY